MTSLSRLWTYARTALPAPAHGRPGGDGRLRRGDGRGRHPDSADLRRSPAHPAKSASHHAGDRGCLRPQGLGRVSVVLPDGRRRGSASFTICATNCSGTCWGSRPFFSPDDRPPDVADHQRRRSAAARRVGDDRRSRREGLSLVLFTAVLVYDARLALVCFTGAPIVLYPLVQFGRRVRRTAAAWEALEHMSHVSAEAFTGHRIVKPSAPKPGRPSSFRTRRTAFTGRACESPASCRSCHR